MNTILPNEKFEYYLGYSVKINNKWIILCKCCATERIHIDFMDWGITDIKVFHDCLPTKTCDRCGNTIKEFR
jgi:hypothetical protein